jgi:hypothetical protein
VLIINIYSNRKTIISLSNAVIVPSILFSSFKCYLMSIHHFDQLHRELIDFSYPLILKENFKQLSNISDSSVNELLYTEIQRFCKFISMRTVSSSAGIIHQGNTCERFQTLFAFRLVLLVLLFKCEERAAAFTVEGEAAESS